MKNACGTGSFQRMSVTFVIGSLTSAWSMIVMPRVLASGHMSSPSAIFLPGMILVIGPYALSLYAVMLLSGSTSWNGRMIEDGQQATKRLYSYLNIWFLGASLSGLTCSILRLITTESYSTIYVFTGLAFLVVSLASLWSPGWGLLRQK